MQGEGKGGKERGTGMEEKWEKEAKDNGREDVQRKMSEDMKRREEEMEEVGRKKGNGE